MARTCPVLSPAQRIRSIRITFFALAYSVVVYGFLGFMATRSAGSAAQRPPMPEWLRISDMIAILVSLIALTAAWMVGTALGPRPEPAAIAEAQTDTSATLDRLRRISTAVVTMCAITESVAILGLVFLFAFSLPFDRFLRFIILPLVIHGVIFFRLQGWIAAEQQGV